MKYLLVFLLILGVYCACRKDQFNLDGTCVDCKSSPCKTCQGDDNCVECYEGMSLKNSCYSCTDRDTIPINGKCVSCSSLGADSNDNGYTCECTGADNCCPADRGVYLESRRCYSCSDQSMGCQRCSINDDDYFICSRCMDGYRLVNFEGSRICASSSTYLFALGGLLISLLILL